MLVTTESALLRRLATEQAAARVPSIVAAVVRDGEVVWWGARGSVDGTPPDDDTQYRLGSITKSLVAVLVMRLRDEGRVDLNDPLEKHVPGTSFGSSTVGQLLSHTGGLTAESPGSWWERTPGGDWAALQASLASDAVKNRPGSRFHYSNVGFGVLGELVARHRGRSWLEALRVEVLAPLGMTRTTPHPSGRHAQGYAVHPFADLLLPEPSPDAGAMAPAGQLWSTVRDLARWTSFVGGDTGDVLRPETMAEMRAVATVEDGDSWTSGYGLGLQLVRHQGRRLAGHTGSMPGFLATNLVDEVSGTGALALANTTSGPAILGLVVDLIGLADEHEPKLPPEWRPSEVDRGLLELTGLWHWGPTPYLLRLIPGDLFELTPVRGSGRASRFRRVGQDEWLGLDGYYAGETLRVGRGADGVPLYLDLVTFVFTRTPFDPAAPVPGGVDDGGWRVE
ncbi:CubicO group peptidase (beta-lactamase class C family) [Amycolatopsis bartoniae]|uniref:Serine hydrolase n=1 Tax=Amycolatopsis bartoniae TaxID=941986 RepID=A0A8H9IPF9_9PSEU|nr:serine hydrolase domain-containing protein [Amycolatopsis bartoniae]MBB2934930.1 CubicO group peptidase (beta-lactamase class C family) [Amycolatopsis bartoniae]TVS99564.1 beta-lactamase family protein [Amycolatopsis bartoniae]GHF43749.1 serine hydrolase [Amycolatopsis bartoniae]